MFCSNCGKELEEGAKFCTACGCEVGRQGKIMNMSSNISLPSGAIKLADVKTLKILMIVIAALEGLICLFWLSATSAGYFGKTSLVAVSRQGKFDALFYGIIWWFMVGNLIASIRTAVKWKGGKNVNYLTQKIAAILGLLCFGMYAVAANRYLGYSLNGLGWINVLCNIALIILLFFVSSETKKIAKR